MALFQNVWILNTDGLCLLHRNYSGGDVVDETLFGGFLTAIVHMTKDINIGTGESGFEKISMGSVELYYRPVEGMKIAMVASVDKKAKDKDVQRLLGAISKEFYTRFANELERMVIIDQSKFLPFGDYIDASVDSKGRTLKTDQKESEFAKILTGIKEGLTKDPGEAINKLVEVYESMQSDKARKMVRDSMKDVEKLVASSTILSKDQKALFSRIITGVTAKMKVEKFLMEF